MFLYDYLWLFGYSVWVFGARRIPCLGIWGYMLWCLALRTPIYRSSITQTISYQTTSCLYLNNQSEHIRKMWITYAQFVDNLGGTESLAQGLMGYMGKQENPSRVFMFYQGYSYIQVLRTHRFIPWKISQVFLLHTLF